ncbi:FRG domain-containing protein [Mariniflexile litorale]|uniref:FRG domain-containing protein n=1 Tax=Mariniflexile litorale TaxID=3045158 RepID=A0AAU7EJH5_9FLAO|nr:FRG domain-containing protein [Mariniflexile sp. KMM 9835]MDQ8211174.1 FRG domain-containing protein [Mariniflexile sp. KMM 9835]
MGLLPNYKDFTEKRESFAYFEKYTKIDTIEEFNNLYKLLQNQIKDKVKIDENKDLKINSDFIFRGMGEAKYKLYNSAQRFWITNEVEQWWLPRSYLEFINEFILKARDKKLFNKIFEYYNLKANQRDFPILSILQHYGAPTPLMDFTYDLDVALFFATERATPTASNNEIDKYFSIYFIDKNFQKHNELNNLIDFTYGSFPRLSSFYDWEKNKNSIFYLSDFENKMQPKNSFRDERPITTIYNQNIIPQQGLFIFNPFPNKPLEDCFNTNHNENGNNLKLKPFFCFDIKKDLGEYIRRSIKKKNIDKSYIYPHLNSYCNLLIEEFLDSSI